MRKLLILLLLAVTTTSCCEDEKVEEGYIISIGEKTVTVKTPKGKIVTLENICDSKTLSHYKEGDYVSISICSECCKKIKRVKPPEYHEEVKETPKEELEDNIANEDPDTVTTYNYSNYEY